MRVLLIRHGQTPSNVAGALDTGLPGAPLSALGRAQAAAVPAALTAEPVVAVYASPLIRTQLTAAPLAAAQGLGVAVRAGLAEVPAGEYEMRSDADAVHRYIGCLVAWLGGDLDRVMPGGIDGHAFWQRFDAAIGDIAAGHAGDDTVAVFTHGAAMRVYTTLAARLDPAAALELRVANTGMGVLSGDPTRGWRLERWVSDPLGGRRLLDQRAHDVTAESAEDATDGSTSS